VRNGVTAGLLVFLWLLVLPLTVAWPGGGLMPGGWADPLLVIALCAAMFVRPGWAAVIGGMAGLCQGALAGSDLTILVLTRAVAGFGLSMFCSRDVPFSTFARVVLVIVTALITQLFTLFLAPPPDVFGFLRATIVSATINGVLAWPLCVLLQSLVGRRVI